MSISKRAKTMVKGLVIDWIDNRADEFTTVDHLKINASHKNPIWRLLAYEMFRQHVRYITIQQAFLWKVTIYVVFQYPNGMEQTETTELESFTKLTDLNDLILDEIKQDKRKGSHFKHVKFIAECLDTHPKKERVV
ncbi:hypothetical protein TDB9533_01257 [Thalassocella blandensis]|nr:hypothetical protein TDB9533_01257 [Thalassocella blandensis]